MNLLSFLQTVDNVLENELKIADKRDISITVSQTTATSLTSEPTPEMSVCTNSSANDTNSTMISNTPNNTNECVVVNSDVHEESHQEKSRHLKSNRKCRRVCHWIVTELSLNYHWIGMSYRTK